MAPNLLPKKLIRLDDGMEFILNEKTNEYCVHTGIPNLDNEEHLHWGYSYERLMEDDRSKGKFKIADGTEDIQAMKKAWFEKVKRNGGDDYD